MWEGAMQAMFSPRGTCAILLPFSEKFYQLLTFQETYPACSVDSEFMRKTV
jgi:hypothetical protein